LKMYQLSLSSNRIKVIFQNETDKQLFLDKHIIDDKQGHLVPGSGVDLVWFQPLIKKSDPVKRKEPFTFLFSSRMLKDKGLLELCEAITILKERQANVNLLLAGTIDYGNPASVSAKWLRQISKLDYIEWLGFVVDIRQTYAQCDAVVLPSYREGLSHTLIEALAMGKPIITTDVPGCREVIDRNGFKVPAQNVQALVEALSRMMNSNLQEFGTNSLKLAHQFDIRSVNNKTMKIYEN